MIKRPLNPLFREKVLNGTKTTTIREKPWPVGVPIMLFNWSGKAYKSNHFDVAVVVVQGFWTIRITHSSDGEMLYECGQSINRPLYQTEGFDSRAEMDAWFRPLVKPGKTITLSLMRFRMVCP